MEVNPLGAYGVVEEGSGLPLSQATADTLIAGAGFRRLGRSRGTDGFHRRPC
jgi:hypothetical protein